MSEKELTELRKRILKEQQKVQSSKKAAQQYLIELGVLTKKGNLKKALKPVQ